MADAILRNIVAQISRIENVALQFRGTRFNSIEWGLQATDCPPTPDDPRSAANEGRHFERVFKRSYRKLTLTFHPDKIARLHAEATVQFRAARAYGSVKRAHEVFDTLREQLTMQPPVRLTRVPEASHPLSAHHHGMEEICLGVPETLDELHEKTFQWCKSTLDHIRESTGRNTLTVVTSALPGQLLGIC
jgi:hypothetical protein